MNLKRKIKNNNRIVRILKSDDFKIIAFFYALIGKLINNVDNKRSMSIIILYLN